MLRTGFTFDTDCVVFISVLHSSFIVSMLICVFLVCVCDCDCDCVCDCDCDCVCDCDCDCDCVSGSLYFDTSIQG